MENVFNTEANHSEGDNGQNNEGLTGSFVEKLVQAKGDSWKDPEVMAKGKLEADQMIEDLQQQVEVLRKGSLEQNYAKELIERLEKQGAAPAAATPPQPNNSGTDGDNNTKFDPSDVENLVENLLTKREQEQAMNNNINKVNREMTERFGTEAGAEVSKRARELGMSVDQMQEVAGKSPDAFLRLMGDQPRSASPVVHGSLNAVGNHQPKGKGWSYYRELRKSDERSYRSAAIQNEIVAASRADPDFFKK